MTKKNYMIIAVILVAIVAGFIWWNSMRTERIPENVAPADTTDAIQAELNGINIGDVGTEFKDVDETIKSL